jgi:N-acetylneuraminic acid mutarotase
MRSTILLFPLVATVAPACVVLACSSPGDVAQAALRAPPGAHEAIAGLRATFRDRSGLPVIDRGASAATSKRATARVELPSLASERVKLADEQSGMEIAFTIAGANPGVELVEGELAVYVGGGPSGGDVVRRLRSDGVEDFVTLPARPPRDELRYRVDLAGTAGLRLVDGVLELLDEGGAPRLRVGRPYVVDAHGVQIEARLDLEGCVADKSFEPPWSRSVTPPGSTTCEVVVRWDGNALAYPAIVDPAWTSANTLPFPTWRHAASLVHFPGRPSGLVLVAGGIVDTSDNATNTCALYDPMSQTWGMTSAMSVTREQHVAITLDDGRVLVAGGYGLFNTLWSSAEIFDPATSAWKPAAPMSEGRYAARATRLLDGTVLVTGGYNFNPTTADASADEIASAEIYVPSKDKWLSAGTMHAARGEHTATLDADGNVLVAGGGHAGAYTEIPNAELFLFNSHTWMQLPSMPKERTTADAARIGEKILIAGGQDSPSTSIVFDTTTKSWEPMGYIDPPSPTSASQRLETTLTVLPNGGVLIAGGFRPPTSSLFDPCTEAWVDPENMTSAHQGHTATLLDDGSVLVAGGATPTGFGGSAVPTYACELFRLVPSGGACSSGVQCASGECSANTCVGADTDAGAICDHDAGPDAAPDADAGPDATPSGIGDKSYLSCATRAASGDPRALALGLLAALALLRRSRS